MEGRLHQNVRSETLYIVCFLLNIFAVFDIVLWLEEDADLQTNYFLPLFKLIESKAQNQYKILSFLSHTLISNTASLNILDVCNQHQQEFHFPNFDSCGSLGRKV